MRGRQFSQPINRSFKVPPPESSHWFWNPNRVGVKFAPEWFASKLKDFDPELMVTWDSYQEKWLVWMRSPRIQTKLCSGWMLLFPLRYSDNSYMPLDERVFARLYEASDRRWGNGKSYFDHIATEQQRDRDKVESDRSEQVKYSAGEYYDYMKIKNIGSGSKFATHFA